MKKAGKAMSIFTSAIKKAALSTTKHSLDSACVYTQYQPKMPKSLKKNWHFGGEKAVRRQICRYCRLNPKFNNIIVTSVICCLYILFNYIFILTGGR